MNTHLSGPSAREHLDAAGGYGWMVLAAYFDGELSCEETARIIGWPGDFETLEAVARQRMKEIKRDGGLAVA